MVTIQYNSYYTTVFIYEGVAVDITKQLTIIKYLHKLCVLCRYIGVSVRPSVHVYCVYICVYVRDDKNSSYLDRSTKLKSQVDINNTDIKCYISAKYLTIMLTMKNINII